MCNVVKTAVLIIGVVALALAGGPAAAAAGDSGWQLRLFGAWVDPDPSLTVINDEGQAVTVGSSSALGFGGGIAYRSSTRWSWSFDVLTARPELSIEVEVEPGLALRAVDKVRTTPYLVGADFHLTPGRAVDVSIGAVLAWVRFGDPAYNLNEDKPFRVRLDDKAGIGARLGVATRVGESPWSVAVGITYLDIDLEAREADDPGGDSEEFPFDPLIVTVGIGYRF